MKKRHFIIVIDGSSYESLYKHMLVDLEEREDVTFVTDTPCSNGFKRLLLKKKIQVITQGYLDFLAYEENRLYEAVKKISPIKKVVYVIFLNAALFYNNYLAGTLLKYKKKWKNLSYVLFYLDITGVDVSINADYLLRKKIFDLAYTIDFYDAEKYNMLLRKTFYSKISRCSIIEPEYDLYFCGASKKRVEILAECMKYSRQNRIQTSMDIVCYDGRDILQTYKPNITIMEPGDFLSYSDVLTNVLKSFCILDIVQEGQYALSLRPYEAVCYNRKLLTNNKTILEFSYYNPQFMQYFEKPDDIDWNWVKNKETVDYHYKGEFSPVNLLTDIIERSEANG